MKACVLASGSKGNSTYIETEHHKMLIDLGTSSLYVEKKLKELNVNPGQIDSIFITHTHVDHISGLRVFLKKYHPTIYLSEKMKAELEQQLTYSKYQVLEKNQVIDDLSIQVFKTSHDTDDSNGYLIEESGHSLVYITDTGYLNMKYHKLLENKNLYIIESNHDIKMLMDGHYPYHIKQRILGDKGHLSNKDCSYYLSHLIGSDTKNVVLIHLSEDNNRPELALETLQSTLEESGINHPKIYISSQKEKTEMIEV